MTSYLEIARRRTIKESRITIKAAELASRSNQSTSRQKNRTASSTLDGQLTAERLFIGRPTNDHSSRRRESIDQWRRQGWFGGGFNSGFTNSPFGKYVLTVSLYRYQPPTYPSIRDYDRRRAQTQSYFGNVLSITINEFHHINSECLPFPRCYYRLQSLNAVG